MAKMIPSAVGISCALVFLGGCMEAPDSPPTVKQMSEACISQGKTQGLEVHSVGSFRTIGGSGGQAIGADTTMGVSRAGQTYDVRCSYSFGDGQARITSM